MPDSSAGLRSLGWKIENSELKTLYSGGWENGQEVHKLNHAIGAGLVSLGEQTQLFDSSLFWVLIQWKAALRH